MSVVIRVENLSKCYTLKHQGQSSGNGLRHALHDAVTVPFQRGKQKSPVTSSSEETFWALKDVSFEVKQGEVLGIIGRNGAGKSTLLKLLSRITEPTKGRIGIKGRVASLLEVGTGFHPELTGRENIFLNGAILGMTRAEIRGKFDEIVAFAEVERFLDTPVKRYSSGMYVRLAFAVAAHLEPEILIVDEVLAVGDAEFQKKCLGKMQEVSVEQGRTVIFVSHQLGSVRRLCNSACLMIKGQTIGIESVESAMQKYGENLKESPLDLNLDVITRNSNLGSSAKLTRLTIPEDSSLTYGSSLVIQFMVRCSTPVRGAILGIGFDTPEGVRILTLDSDNSASPLNLTTGVHKIRMEIARNPLHPGVYVCGTCIISGGITLDTLPNCATWEISAGESDAVSGRGFAGCRLPIQLVVTKESTSGQELK